VQYALKEPEKSPGALIPIFDRLINNDYEENTEIPPKKFYNFEELLESLRRDIERLFSTRAMAKHDHYDNMMEYQNNRGLPEMYGLPDFSKLDATNSDDQYKITKIAERAIRYYESRLENPTMEILRFVNSEQKLLCEIRGLLNVPPYQREVSFRTVMFLST
jgi:type VI secretion system lysozyme-like protein